MPKGIAKNVVNSGQFRKGNLANPNAAKNLTYRIPKGNIPWNIGKKMSEETKNKIREKRKLQVFSDETRKKLSKAHSGHHRGGWKLKIETRKKMSESHKGDKCNFWKGGKTLEIYPFEWRDILKDSIRERDDYTCQECGIHQDEFLGRTKKLDIHHIDYDKENLDPNNLISLCRTCHSKTNVNREYWIEYFKN
jgi:hypothetical protein